MVDNTSGGSDVLAEAPGLVDGKAGVLGKVEELLSDAARAVRQLYQRHSDGSPTGLTGVFGKPVISGVENKEAARPSAVQQVPPSEGFWSIEQLAGKDTYDGVHYRDRAGNSVTEFPYSHDKRRVIEEQSGITFIEYADGRHETVLPEGSFVETRADGAERIRTPGGYTVTQHEDGTREVKDPSELTITTLPNGDVEFQYPDRKDRIIYHRDGRVEAVGEKFEGETAEAASEKELDRILKMYGLPAKRRQ